MDAAERAFLPKDRIERAAARRFGLILREEAVEAGMSTSAIQRRLACGAWARVLPGVFRVAAVPRSWEQSVLAACLWSDGVASHRAAAAIWRLDGVPARVVEVTVGRRLRGPNIRLHQAELGPAEVTRVGRIPVTDVARTLLDLGAVVSEATLRIALDDAIRRRMVNAAKLHRRVEELGGRGRRGWGIVRVLLEEPRAESVLERRVLRLLRTAGLPSPVTQHEVRDRGRFVARVDFAYPEVLVAIEAEGFRFHGGPEAYARDLARRNRLTALGWRVLHVTWSDVTERPSQVAEQVRRALGG